MVAQRIRLYSTRSLPSWVGKVDIGPGFIKMKRNLFPDGSIGLINVSFGTWDWPIPYSSAERAFIELASTLETREDILQAKLMLEGAANLRPMLLQSLLEACGNIQTKRLFLWLARTIGHPWYKHINISRINLGTGKRQVVSGGTLDAQFLITVPKEVQD